MDLHYLACLDADPDFYDDTWQVAPDGRDVLGPAGAPAGRPAPGSGDPLSRAGSGLLDGVTVTDHGPWRLYRTGAPLPSTGWKVHVSCVPDRAAHVVDVAVRTALRSGLTCKHLRTRRLVTSSQAKYAEPTAAGKVVTIYPANDVALEQVVCALTDLLAGEPGARVLSDIPVDGAPVSVRYGAFMGVHLLDELGSCVVGMVLGEDVSGPDNRSPHSAPRGDERVPAFVRTLQERADRRDRAAVLPVEKVCLLHRSNAGGVYAASWEQGADVVVKEARRHTGYDQAGSDAVARLRHERRVLERLSGTRAVPEVVDYVTAGASEFLVMERVEGALATATMATSHPGAVPGGDAADYRRWVQRVVDGTRVALEVLHAHGVAHLDVHPGNVIERDGRVVLIDLESAAIDGVAVARGVGTVLSSCGDDVSTAADLVALGRMRALLVNPQFSLTARRPDLAEELVTAGELDLGDAAPRETPRAAAPEVSRIVAGLHVCADPARSDRLFPADVTSFGVPGAGLGMLHGAGGVLGVLEVGGHPVPEEWHAWLRTGARRAAYLAPGLADGADGTALCLARIGETSAAREVIGRWGHRTAPTPWWARGTAGQAVAHAELGLLLGDRALRTSAVGLAEETVVALERGSSPPGHRAGLLHGWAGVGLALLRVAECLDATANQTEADSVGSSDRLRTAARAALERETDSVRLVADAWMTTDGWRLMPYLGTGSTALGLLATALGGRAAQGDSSAGDTTRLDIVVAGVLRALRLRTIACSGLLHGRAGLLIGLLCLAPDEPTVQMHRQRLGWHRLPVTTTSRRSHPLAGQADLLLGDQNLRASADLASGAAGVLLAASGDDRTAARRTVEVLCLPRCAAPFALPTSPMTPVSTTG